MSHHPEWLAALVRIIGKQKLEHVVMPLMTGNFAWSARHLYEPASQLFLESMLCFSAIEIWVESMRRAWREEDPPGRPFLSQDTQGRIFQSVGSRCQG